MTEKRFNVFKYPDCKEFGVSDDVTDCDYGRFNYYEAETLCKILNELHDENKELKEGVEEFNEICKYYEMRIKELSEQADAVRTELQLCEEENNELQKENEQLKQQLIDEKERETPITSTNSSDGDFKKFEEFLKKHYR